MYYAKINSLTFIIRLEKGEEVVSSLSRFSDKLKIQNAFFTGLGSAENPVLAHYSVDTKKYIEKKLQGIFEVANLTGNVAVFQAKPLVHAHITLGDKTMASLAGHLVNSLVSATLEIKLDALKGSRTKSYNREIGLKLWDLEKVF